MGVNSRKEAERLVERGSWVKSFNPGRVTTADGVSSDYVEVDPLLKPTQRYVWLFFYKFGKYSSAEFDQRVDQSQIAEWRRRLPK